MTTRDAPEGAVSFEQRRQQAAMGLTGVGLFISGCGGCGSCRKKEEVDGDRCSSSSLCSVHWQSGRFLESMRSVSQLHAAAASQRVREVVSKDLDTTVYCYKFAVQEPFFNAPQQSIGSWAEVSEMRISSSSTWASACRPPACYHERVTLAPTIPCQIRAKQGLAIAQERPAHERGQRKLNAKTKARHT